MVVVRMLECAFGEILIREETSQAVAPSSAPPAGLGELSAVETLALTREELVDFVQTVAAEVVREMRLTAAPGTKPLAAVTPCTLEMCPHNPGPAAVDARAVPVTADVRRLSSLIDHTLLRPEATRTQIEQICNEALLLGCAAVCVNPAWVPFASERLRGSAVKVATVVGFPFGATLTSAKRAEAVAAVQAGAHEIDMVMNVGALRSGEPERVEADIRGVVEVGHAGGARVKVILENAFLSDAQKVAACQIAQRAGADFVKTSTGFGPSGATEADVRLMRQTVGPEMGVKAAAGIRTLADVLRMLEAGANRLGMSATVAVLAEAARQVN